MHFKKGRDFDMKKSTKVIATVVAATTMLVGVVGCSKKSGVEGKYTAEYDVSEQMGADEGSYVMDFTLELNDDDTFTFEMDSTAIMEAMAEMMGYELSEEDLEDSVMTVEGHYSVDGDEITLTAEEDGEEDDLVGTIEDGDIVLDMDGMELTFSK